MNNLPSKKEILNWIENNPTLTSKRDIAKAFGIKGAARVELKNILSELKAEGHIEKRDKSHRSSEILSPVSVLQIMAPTQDGDIFARPLEWQGQGQEPIIYMQLGEKDPALGYGDRILARVSKVSDQSYDYEGRIIRKISVTPDRILGVFRTTVEGGRIIPIDKTGKEWSVTNGDNSAAKDGELVEAEQSGPKGRLGLPRARIISVIGDPSAPKAMSLIAIHQHNIPDRFPQNVIDQADKAKPAGLKGRLDLRHLPLITIDPADARDHDDACYAQTDDDPKNVGGHILWVAIADVAHYVPSGSPLDIEARKRGNSTYFPDRVVPMLPDRLSGDLCSLHEGVPRAVIAVEIKIDKSGNKLSHKFHRALMQSHASLNYNEVQSAMDGHINERVSPLLETVIRPLYAAYGALVVARNKRQPLELDLPERQIELSDLGKVTSVNFKDRIDAHRLIEEFMVLANVCAAETLIEKKSPLLFRVHEEPNPEKFDALREVAQSAGLTLAKGQVLKTSHLNRLLEQAANTDEAELINMSTLRSMTQAYYSPENFSHFGLALQNYAHFTSPIRRYADLIVHRSLVSAHGWGNDGLTEIDIENLAETAQKISDTERRSMVAERDTNDRYLAAYLSERIGNEFNGRISGVAKFGIFVRLDDSGADGIVPIRTLGREFFHYERDTNTLIGSETGLTLSLGLRVSVRLSQSEPVAGGIVLELLSINDNALPKRSRKISKTSRKKLNKSRKKSAKIDRKINRKRK